MTDRELISLAEAAGISASYENWRHEQVAVPETTLRAILSALGAPSSLANAAAGADVVPAASGRRGEAAPSGVV